MQKLADTLGVSHSSILVASILAAVGFLAVIVSLAASSQEAKTNENVKRVVDMTQMIGKVVGAFATLIAACILLDNFWWMLGTVGASAVIAVVYLWVLIRISKKP